MPTGVYARTLEHRAKLRAIMIGNQRSLGHRQSDEHRAKITAALTGRQGWRPTDEQRALTSATTRAAMTPEVRARIGAAGIGRPPPNKLPIGAQRVHPTGYVVVKTALPDVWEYEHRAVYEEAYGPIPDGHVVHHIDGDPLNNAIENLDAMSLGAHVQLHHRLAI